MPSGEFGSRRGLAVTAVAGIVTAVAGAWVYDFAVSWIPVPYANLLITIGFGALIAVVVGHTSRNANCRRPMVVVLFAMVCAGLGDRMSFQFNYDRGMATLFENTPRDLRGRIELEAEIHADAEIMASRRKLFLALAGSEELSGVKAAFEFGDWIHFRVIEGWAVGRSSKDSGVPLKGVFVWLIWILEALILIGFTTYITRAIVSVPFDEATQTWMLEEGKLGIRIDADAMADAVSERDVARLMQPKPDPKSPTRLRYRMFRSDASDHAYVTIEHWAPKGRHDKRTVVVSRARIEHADWNALPKQPR